MTRIHDCDIHKKLEEKGLTAGLYGPQHKLRYNDFKDNQWTLFDSEGMINLEDVRFCPYCGEELKKET